MDPNETLRRLRDLLGGDHSGYEPNREETAIRHETKDTRTLGDLHTMLCEAEELFQAMDTLATGGFLPESWDLGGALEDN
jgi:hypothetical protein